MTKTYDLTDSYGRSYFEGRSFDREAALEAAKTIGEGSRPFGVFLVPTDESDPGTQIFFIGDRVEGGDGEDHDVGTVVEVRDTDVIVSWDSGVRTPAPIADLDLAQ